MTWTWDERKRKYVNDEGDELSERELREALDEYIESTQEGMAEQVAEFVAGVIGVAALFQFLDEEVTALHAASGSIAYGGLAQMGSREWDRIGGNLMAEIHYLNQFKQDVHAAEITGELLSEEGIAGRASLYAEAAYSEYMGQVVERESDNGVGYGRRVCEDDATSCEECVEAAGEEWLPLDEIPEIGSLTCQNNCRCEIEFYEGTEEQNVELFSQVEPFGYSAPEAGAPN